MINFLFEKTPLVFFIQSFWRDEAFSYLLAKKPILDILFLSAKDFNPPFYYLLLHFWIKFFGSSEIILRLFSFIFYWATLYLCFLIINEVFKFSLKKSFFYTAFVFFNPFFLYYAFEVRMYTLFAFFVILSFYSLFKKKNRLYLFSLFFGLYTHYFMIFPLLIQMVFFKKKEQFKALLLFLPWLIFITKNQFLNFSNSFWINPLPFSYLVNFLGSLYLGYEKDLIFYDKKIIYVSLLILATIFYGVFFIKWQKKEKKFFIPLSFTAIILPFLIILVSFIKPVFLPRYLIFSSIILVLLIIYIIDKMPLFLKTIFLIFFFFFTLNYHQIQIKERRKVNLRPVIREIKKIMGKDDLLYVANELDFFVAQYYLNDEKRVYIYNKSYEELPQYIGKILINKDQIAKNLPFYPKKAFILQSDGSYNIQSLF